jgi:hypothetical protein
MRKKPPPHVKVTDENDDRKPAAVANTEEVSCCICMGEPSKEEVSVYGMVHLVVDSESGIFLTNTHALLLIIRFLSSTAVIISFALSVFASGRNMRIPARFARSASRR